jgi:hypothetical protein
MQRTLSALGLGASTLGVGSAGALAATKTVSAITAGAVVKWAGIGATVGIVVAGASHRVYQTAARSSPHAAVSVSVSVSASPAPLRALPAAPSAHEAGASSPVEAPSALALPSAPELPPSAPLPVEPDAPLAPELAFVDRGRVAFQRGDAAGALTLLQGYELRFPETRLLPEVLYLRMQALRRQGDAGRAAELAARLVVEFPNNPHASSARLLLDVDGASAR